MATPTFNQRCKDFLLIVFKGTAAFLRDLSIRPQYRTNAEFAAWLEASENLPDALGPKRARQAVEYSWKAYEESRDLHFRGEAKRDEFLKFASALIVFQGAALSTGRFTWNVSLVISMMLPTCAAALLVLSRRSISLPGLPDTTSIRESLAMHDSVRIDGEWMARNLGQAREGLRALQSIRARQLDVSLWLIVVGLIFLCVSVFSPIPAATSSSVDSSMSAHPVVAK